MASKFSPEQEKDIYLAYLKDPCYARVAGKFAIKPETVKAIKIRIKARAIQDDAVQSMGASTSTNAPIGNSFADYVKLRERGKTCADCVVQLQLTPEKAEEFEKAYLHVKDLDQCSAFAMRLHEERIDVEPFIKDVEENGSIESCLKRLAEIKAMESNERTKLRETQSQYQRLLQNYQNLTRANMDLKTSNNSLAKKHKNLEGDIEDKIRTRDDLSHLLDQALADYNLAIIEKEWRTTQAARKLIEEFMKNDNRKLEALLVSLIWALRGNPAALFEIYNRSGPILPEEAPTIYRKFDKELAISVYYCQTLLNQTFINAAVDDDRSQNEYDKLEPQPPSISSIPQQMAAPSGINFSGTLLSITSQPPNTYPPSPLDIYAKEQAAHQQQQHPPTALAAPENAPAVLLPERSYSLNTAPDSGTCNNGQDCTLNRIRQKT